MATTKLSIEELQSVLIDAGINDINDRKRVLEEAQKRLKEIEEDKADSKSPKSKYRYAVCVRGDEALKEILQEAWIVKMPEAIPEDDLIERIKKAARENNNNSKRQKSIVKTFRDVFAYLKRKYSKAENFQPINKEPCRVHVLTSENIND